MYTNIYPTDIHPYIHAYTLAHTHTHLDFLVLLERGSTRSLEVLVLLQCRNPPPRPPPCLALCTRLLQDPARGVRHASNQRAQQSNAPRNARVNRQKKETMENMRISSEQNASRKHTCVYLNVSREIKPDRSYDVHSHHLEYPKTTAAAHQTSTSHTHTMDESECLRHFQQEETSTDTAKKVA